jgi:hypothetical protein
MAKGPGNMNDMRKEDGMEIEIEFCVV